MCENFFKMVKFYLFIYVFGSMWLGKLGKEIVVYKVVCDKDEVKF